MASFAGMCAGGPLDGKMYVGEARRICIPIYRAGHFIPEHYKFNELLRMWVWEGQWPDERPPRL